MKVVIRVLTTTACVVAVAFGALVFHGYGPKLTATDAVEQADTAQPTPQVVRTSKVVHSPDGTLQVTLTSVPQQATGPAITVSVSNTDGTDRKILYRTTLENGWLASAPANAWSPDNRLVFVILRDTADMDALVLRASGEPFADGVAYMSVSEHFHASYPEISIRDITGWDSPELIHIMTYAPDGEKGFSYRFDAWGKGVYRLSHR